MSYTKKTFISGKSQGGERKTVFLHGHWKIKNAVTKSRRMGFVGKFTVKHTIFDNSGMGRGGMTAYGLLTIATLQQRLKIGDRAGRRSAARRASCSVGF